MKPPPTWFELGGSYGWVREVRRMLELGQSRCWSADRQQLFRATCRRLEPWRLRSSVHCNTRDVPAIADLLEHTRRHGGRMMRPGLFPADPGWTRAELGELLVEARNRLRLAELGRDRARLRGPRFDLDQIPLDRLEALIQRHPDLALVDQLREARNRRLTSPRI